MKKCAWHGFINGRILIKIPSTYFLSNRIGFFIRVICFKYSISVCYQNVQWVMSVEVLYLEMHAFSLLKVLSTCFYGLAGVGLQMYTGISFYISQHPMWHSFMFFANQISDQLGGGGYDSSVGDKCFASFLDRELEGRIIIFVFFLLMAFNVLYACFLALRMK